MLTIVQRGGATREKPPEVVRGYSSRLPWAWDGLCFATAFNDATRDSARDLVANAVPSAWGGLGTPVWEKDNRGNVALKQDTSTYIAYPENPVHNRPTTALTAYARLRRAGTAPVGSGAVICKVHTEGVDPWRTWAIQISDSVDTQLAASITVNGTNLYWENSGYSSDTSTWMSAFLRWTSGTAPRQDILGERGQPYSSAAYGSTVSGTLTYNASPQPIRINTGDSLENAAYYGSYSQVMVWSRRLTDTELQALVADPYGWYSPRRSTVIVDNPYTLYGGQSFMREVSSG